MPEGLDRCLPLRSLELLNDGLLLGMTTDGPDFLAILVPSYLVAWLFCLSVTMGSHAWLWVHHLTGGAWGNAIDGTLRASARTLPLVVAGFLPIAWNVETLYAWSRSTSSPATHPWSADAWWLQVPAFYIRSLIYFLVWLFFSWRVGRRERRFHAQPTTRHASQLRTASGQALLAYGLTMTLASYDFAMSLERHWYSAAYGIIFVMGQALAGLSWSILQTASGSRAARPLRQPDERVSVDERSASGESHLADNGTPSRSETGDLAKHVSHDLGNLLLAFTMIWTYVAFSQFLIIWYADLPEEVVWYLTRSRMGWQWVALALAVFHFAVPFLVLLSRTTKQSPHRLALVATLILFMRWVDLSWHVLPVFTPLRWQAMAVATIVMGLTGLVWWLWYRWQRSRVRDLLDRLPMVEGSERRS